MRSSCGPLIEGFLQLILPSTCAACTCLCDEGAAFCEPCGATLDPVLRACPRCALPLGGEGDRSECLGCLRAPPPWASAIAPYVFGAALAQAVRAWKLGARQALAGGLGAALAPSLSSLAPGVDALVPVPLHPRRLRARGFNQAFDLARSASRRAGPRAPGVADLLDRVRDTPPQATLDRAGRRDNVRGAFRVRGRWDVIGAHLCLIDDVMTTGATLAACAEALQEAGAARVDVLTLARALP